MAVIRWLAPCSANWFTLCSQSVSNARSVGGNTYGFSIPENSFEPMPLISPARLPSVCGRRSVLPPRKNTFPVRSFAVGFACRNIAIVVNAAFLFDFSISRVTGMYFVAPVVVPLDRA